MYRRHRKYHVARSVSAAGEYAGQPLKAAGASSAKGSLRLLCADHDTPTCNTPSPPPGRRLQQQPCGEEGPYAALLVARAVAAGSRIFRQRCCPHLSVPKHQRGGQPIVTQHSTHTSCTPKGAGGTRNHLCITYLPATVKCRNRKI